MNRLQRKEIVVLVAKRLLSAGHDEIVSLQQLSEAAGIDLADQRWVVYAALQALNTDYGIVFASVRKEGYRRLAHAEGALFAGSRGLVRVRRASRTALKQAENSARHANDMNADERRRHNQQMASLGLIAHLTMEQTIKAMPEAAPPVRVDPLAGLREALGL